MRLDRKLSVVVLPTAYIYFAILLFFVPLKWLIAWGTAVIFHELCHWLAVKICGASVYQLTIGIGGIVMQSQPVSDKKRLFAILCGPLGGFVLAMFGSLFPRVALCSWVLSVYNLLPLMPLDGGRALEILLKQKHKIRYVEMVVLISLSILALYLTVILNLGILPAAIVGTLWVKNKKTLQTDALQGRIKEYNT